MNNSNDCDQSNVMVFLKKIERLESRIRQLEVDLEVSKEYIYSGLEKLYEKIEEMVLKVK
jgi:hypothetical protein